MSNANMINAFDALDRICGSVPYTAEEHYYEILDEVSIALVDYRIAHNLSQKQLADVLGISQAMVSKYESGDYNISLKALIELFAKLSIPLNISIGKNGHTAADSAPYVPCPGYKPVKNKSSVPAQSEKTQGTAA